MPKIPVVPARKLIHNSAFMTNNSNLSKTRRVYEDPEIVTEFWKTTKDFSMKQQLEDFISFVGNNGEVLDLGCGPGRDSRYLAEKGCKVIGIDYSSEMIKLARKLHGHLKNIHFKKMDMRRLEFKNKRFNGVWACASLLHIPKKEISKVLKEVWKVLKDKGIFFVAVKKGNGEKIITSGKYGKPMERFFSFFGIGELTRFLKNANFEIIKRQIEKRGDTKWIQILVRKI